MLKNLIDKNILILSLKFSLWNEIPALYIKKKWIFNNYVHMVWTAISAYYSSGKFSLTNNYLTGVLTDHWWRRRISEFFFFYI